MNDEPNRIDMRIGIRNNHIAKAIVGLSRQLSLPQW